MATTFLGGVAARRGVALAFAAQCFIAGSAAAQISGLVTRAGGLPLEGVSIEAWSVDRRVGATITDAQGVYSFSETIAMTTVMLRFGAVGFEVAEVAVRRGGPTSGVLLVEAPRAADGLGVALPWIRPVTGMNGKQTT